MRVICKALLVLFLPLVLLLVSQNSDARNPYRRAFFNVYTSANNTQLDDLPSNAGHCGVCHFDFDGGGPRNPYGLTIETNLGNYPSVEDVVMAVANLDPDNDGYTSAVEITSVLFGNTPTFPGLAASNVSQVMNVTPSDVTPYLTPSGGSDTTPPAVTVLTPNGGENYNAETTPAVTWTATDASGISHIDIYMSDDNGATFKQVAKQEDNDGTFSWFVPNRPGAQTLIRVVARDNAGNYGDDASDAVFTITATPAGFIPTTLRDFDLPGTQPFEGAVLVDPDQDCATCHGNYNPAQEPWYQWKGSMMAHAMRDPLFLACMAVAEQDVPSVGDLCIRCHSPGGWQEGRSVDTKGGLLNAKDRQSVQCDFCHRLVDPIYKPGVSPVEDLVVLDSLDVIPLAPANGQFINDWNPLKRGPYSDAAASHQFLQSPFHRAHLCGTCHDVSNPAFVRDGGQQYSPNGFDAPHPDGDLRNMMPVERTFSEWSVSEYATNGVYAPVFAGAKPDGIVSICQDCHQRDLIGVGSNQPGSPTRSDLPWHDLTGGNTLIPDILPTFFPSEVNAAQLQDGKIQALAMLHTAATMELSKGQDGLNPTVTVKITNQTGHKLPSGYPEGRRIWINVKAYDASMTKVYESGEYNFVNDSLIQDADEKIYRIKPGISTRLAPVLGLPAAPSFHFVLNDTVYSDNRIPPRGFTNANFELIQSPVVHYSYPDSQYWDETLYTLPQGATHVEVTLYYQTTSKEYVEFLRDENVTNSAGIDFYNAWVAQGGGDPVVMVSDAINVEIDPTGAGDAPPVVTSLLQNHPNPFNPTTTIPYSMQSPGEVSIMIYDVRGSLIRTLIDERKEEGIHRAVWDGRNDAGESVSSGIYFYKMITGEFQSVRKAVLLK